jgi:hypothetical protein
MDYLEKFRLPVGEAPRLLRLLAHAGADAASVHPGYDGVIGSLKERRYWETLREADAKGYGLAADGPSKMP